MTEPARDIGEGAGDVKHVWWLRGRVTVIVVLVFWLVGAGSAQAITGGTPLTTPADAPGLVLLQGPAQNGATYCTATLVRARWLVSAAHCFVGATSAAQAPAPDVTKWTARVGWVSNSGTHGVATAIDKIVIDPAYAGGSVHDLALIHVTTAVTTVPPGVTERPVTIASAADVRRVTSADKLWAVGYGTPYDAQGFPVLRTVSLSGRLQVQGDVLRVNVDPKHNVQGGDSGGPLAVNLGGRWLQLGALEGFHRDCRLCASYDIYANLSSLAITSWMNSVVSTPSPPKVLTATPRASGAVALSWSAPEESGDRPVTSYVITWDDGTVDQTRTVAASPTTFTVTGLQPGRSYDFSVAAASASGTGASAQVKGTAGGQVTASANYVLASVSSAGTQGNNASNGGSVSGDGSLVAFESRATNLAGGDTNGTYDVFVRNVTSQRTTMVSTSTTGTQGNGPSFGGQLSPDGTKVLFLSTATNLVAGAPNPGVELAYLKDLTTGVTSLVSAAQSGTPALSTNAVFTRSGADLAVMFSSQATTVVPGAADARDRLYLRNLVTGTVSQISLAGDTGAVLNIAGFALTADGGRLFYSYRDFNGSATERSVFVRDMRTGTTSTVLTANHESDVTSVSADGAVLGLESYASDLVANDSNGVWDAFAVDTATRKVTLLSSDSAGAGGNGSSGRPLLAPDGRSALFSSDATNLVGGDTNGQEDLFRKDLISGATTLLSPAVAGTQNDGFTAAVQFSSDGSKVGVRSSSNRLIATDTNGTQDVFLLFL